MSNTKRDVIMVIRLDAKSLTVGAVATIVVVLAMGVVGKDHNEATNAASSD